MSLEIAILTHRKLCGRFYIQGRTTSQFIYGVCSKCGSILEMHKKAIYAVKVHKVE